MKNVIDRMKENQSEKKIADFKVKQQQPYTKINQQEENKMNKATYYIVRSDRAGVFVGNIKSRKGSEVTMTNVRRVWYWDGAASLSQMAMEGVKRPNSCKFTVTVTEMTILGVIEIIPCEEEAKRNIKAVPVWKI